jgi:hypothetical protein
LECVTKIANGDTIRAKTHAKIGMIARMSMIGVGDLTRFNLWKCIEVLDVTI